MAERCARLGKRVNTWPLLLRSASYVCIGSAFASELEEADVAAVTWRLQLAVLKDAKLDVTALSEPIERMMDKPPPGLLSDAQLNVMEEEKQPTELTESSELSDSDSKEERGLRGRSGSRPRPDL